MLITISIATIEIDAEFNKAMLELHNMEISIFLHPCKFFRNTAVLILENNLFSK